MECGRTDQHFLDGKCDILGGERVSCADLAFFVSLLRSARPVKVLSCSTNHDLLARHFVWHSIE